MKFTISMNSRSGISRSSNSRNAATAAAALAGLLVRVDGPAEGTQEQYKQPVNNKDGLATGADRHLATQI